MKTQCGSIFAFSLITILILLKYSLLWIEIIGCIIMFIWICYDCWKLENYIDELEIYRKSGLKLTLSKEDDLEKANSRIKELEIEVRRLRT